MPSDDVVEQLSRLRDCPYSPEQLERLSASGADRYIEHAGFLIVTPDALYRRLEGSILDELAVRGIFIFRHRLKYLNDKEVEELYKYAVRTKIFEHQRTHWHLTRKGLGFGPSIGLLLFSRSAGLCGELRKLKGAADPWNNHDPASIRFKYRSLSKILALVHTPDDTVSMLRELALYFDFDEALALLDNVRSLDGGREFRAIAPRRVVDSLYRTTPDASPLEVLYAVKCRIVQVFLDSLQEDADGAAPLARLAERLAAIRAELGSHETPWAAVAGQLQPSMREEAAILDPALVEAFHAASLQRAMDDGPRHMILAELLVVLRTLSMPETFRTLPFPRILTLLRAANVHISDWEALVLENLLYFWRVDAGPA